MLINDNYFPEIAFIQNNGNFKFIFQLAFCLVLAFTFYSTTFAQWVSNPEINSKLVVDTNDPINISSVKDFNGGAFIFWQDKKEKSGSQVYFIHVDAQGKVTFRADGKNISASISKKELPVAAESLPNTALVAWKNLGEKGALYAQRVTNNGSYLWQNEGLKLTDTSFSVSDYSFSSDKIGNVYVSYVARNFGINSNYRIEFRKITSDGNFYSDSVKIISSSTNRKSSTSVIPDNLGGAFIYWLENANNKTLLFLQHVNKKDNLDWGQKPIQISDESYSVINYTAKAFSPSNSYVAWQFTKNNKDIFHQLINSKGKLLWGDDGKPVTNQNGNQINPNALAGDSTIFISWTDDFKKGQNIYVQKFNRQGNPLWKNGGLPVIDLKGAQFGQRIIPAKKSGIILSWIDRRQDSTRANIYSQKISNSGEKIWDSLGVATATHYNSPKSYLSLLPDNNSGAIAIFKESRDGKNNIYSQRVFDTGTFASQIIGFDTQLISDSVKISWYSANEQSESIYNIERTFQPDSGNASWEIINTVRSKKKTGSKYYEVFDHPGFAGTIYYKVVGNKPGGEVQTSDVKRVIYLRNDSKVTITQNTPNPFSDSTSINFFLPEKKKVKIEFYNGHLEKIDELEKTFPAGENSIPFSANKLEPGIYFYRFKAGKFIDVKKMVVTKQING